MPIWTKTTCALLATLFVTGCGLASPDTLLPPVTVTGSVPSLSSGAKQVELQKMSELAARHAELVREISADRDQAPSVGGGPAVEPAVLQQAAARTTQ